MREGFFADGRLDYPAAEDLVDGYLAEKAATRERVTSVAVLRWADVANTEHNRRRVYWALADRLEAIGTWDGRVMFRVPGGRR